MFATREVKKQTKRLTLSSKKQTSRDRVEGTRQLDNLPGSTHFLQRNLGNSYLQSMMESPQTIEHHNTQRGEASSKPNFFHAGFSSCCPGKKGESSKIQTKLTIGPANDVYEQEADRVADQVMRMAEPMVKPHEEEEDEEYIQPKRGAGQTSEMSSAFESHVQALRSSGQALPEHSRTFFEPRFGHDFSKVRLHTDALSTETAQALNARAYTMGRDIAFGAGQYAPETVTGKKLLAHELTHVVQQEENIPKQTDRAGEMYVANIQRRPSASHGFGSVPRIQMYAENVHRDKTREWAESFFGRGSGEAATIARENQGVDEGWSHPRGSSIRSFLNPFQSDQDLLHFPSRGVAIRAVRAAVDRANIVDFGKALHRYQDSFSHSFPPPPGTGYNLDSKARHDDPTERRWYRRFHRMGVVATAQRLFPNTLYGRGAVVRHLMLGNYPDDYRRNNEQIAARDIPMEIGSLNWIRTFHSSWTFSRRTAVPVPPGLRVPSLLFGPRHVGPYIRRR